MKTKNEETKQKSECVSKKNIQSEINNPSTFNFQPSTFNVPPSTPGNFTENSVGYFPFRRRANIKIQDGCDAFCTYCIVPYGRGRPRSREWNNTISEFRELVRRDYREIVLTGVNIMTYNDNNRNLVDLLREMISTEGDFRIRLGSTEPQFSLKGLIDVIASSEKICRSSTSPSSTVRTTS